MNFNIFALCITPVAGVQPWWIEWSLAPEFLFPFIVVLYLYIRGSRGRPGRPIALGGFVLLGLALFSPLCRASAGLVSAHMIQLAIIAIIAPAMMASGGAVPALERALRPKAERSLRRLRTRSPLSASAIAYGAALWLWHAPPVYNASIEHAPAHIAITATIVVSALWFFHRLLMAREAQAGSAILILLVTMAHTGLLGALLTFTPEPLYHSDVLALARWGLSARADQQLAGLIMWAPSGLLYLGIALVLTMRLMATSTDLLEQGAPPRRSINHLPN
ncbi:MAG: cytochrome c oxidase assembly protein [Beijerinckiaceae bacterium]